MLTDALRNEVYKFNIKVMSMQPGRTPSNIIRTSLTSGQESKVDQLPRELKELYNKYVERVEKRKISQEHSGSFTPHDAALLLEEMLTSQQPNNSNSIGIEQYQIAAAQLLPLALQEVLARTLYAVN